jgi:hypothetical protein
MGYEETTVVITIDPVWYFSQYPQAKRDVNAGKFSSALDHYLRSGIHYGFLPVEPQVDELWYLVRYPDVSQAIREGRVRSAKAHFVEHGYREGRRPGPDAKAFSGFQKPTAIGPARGRGFMRGSLARAFRRRVASL